MLGNLDLKSHSFVMMETREKENENESASAREKGRHVGKNEAGERESKVEGGAKIVYAMGEFLDEWPGGGR